MTFTTTEIKEIAAAIASIVNTPVLAKPVTTNLVSTRMTFNIEEVLEVTEAAYLTHSTCTACRHEFVELAPIDAGAEYHAFCLPTCPVCVEALGGPLLDNELDEDQTHLVYFAHKGNMGDGFWADEDAYRDFIDGPVDDEYTDLAQEKWDNYYGDFNQCGISVTY